MSLDPLPKVIFLDLSFSKRSADLSEFSTLLSNALGRPYIPLTVTQPLEYVIRDMLAPLYFNPGSPIEAQSLVSQQYHDPIPDTNGLSYTPADLEAAMLTSVPMVLLTALLRSSIAYTLTGTDFPDEMQTSGVVVLDATAYRIELFFTKTAVTPIPAEVCLAIRIRDGGNDKQHVFDSLPCRSINLVSDVSLTNIEVVDHIPFATIVAPNTKVTFP